MGIYKSGRPKKYCPGTETGNRPPAEPGEYRIRDMNGNVTYVGETNNLRRRTNEHMNSGKISNNYTVEYKVADGRSTSRTRREHEQEKIQQLCPSQNRSVGGEGRPAKR